MRMRQIKPNFWTDEKVVELSPWARLLFIGLWQIADDLGRVEWSAKRVKLLLFPADNIDTAELCAELVRLSLVVAYTEAETLAPNCADIARKLAQSPHENCNVHIYLELPNFSKHQKTDKKRGSAFPSRPAVREFAPNCARESSPIDTCVLESCVLEKERERDARAREIPDSDDLEKTRPVEIPPDVLAQARAVFGLTPEATLTDWLGRRGWNPDWLRECIPKAEAKGLHGARAMRYVEAILQSWVRQGGPDKELKNERDNGGRVRNGKPAKQKREPDYSVGRTGDRL